MLDSLRALNDTDVTPEQAVKVINALAASGVSAQMAAGAAAVVGAAHFGGLMERYGVVADGITDDSSALQEAILAARAAGWAMIIPMEVDTIKINSGITLFADSDRFKAQRTTILDCSGITSGSAVNIDCSITDGNVAPFRNIKNFMEGFFLQGSGSPSVAGAAGVNAFRFYSASGKSYFYQVKNCSADGFATTIDLYSNTFGIAFEDFAARSGMGGTLIQCLTGGGANYGERYNFTRAMLYNSGLALLNTNSSSTFRFVNSSFDYCTVMADIRAGRTSLESCHIETNLDTDYLFKISGNEAAALSISNSEIVLNGVNRSNYELFDVDAAIKLGGVSVRDVMLSHGSGYSLPTYVRGDGKALADNMWSFELQPKYPFSRYMSAIRADLGDANALAEFTLSGAVLPVIDAVTKYSGAGSLYFGPSSALSQAEIIVPISSGRQVRGSFRYRKQNSTTGQAKLQATFAWLDSKGTVIGSTATLYDLSGNVEWTLVPLGLNALPPIGARSYRLRLIKSADTGVAGQVWVDDLILNAV